MLFSRKISGALSPIPRQEVHLWTSVTRRPSLPWLKSLAMWLDFTLPHGTWRHNSRLIKSYVPRATVHHNNDLEISYLLPWEAFQRGVFPDLFKELDERSSQLGIKCYGVMDSTLEEVRMAFGFSKKIRLLLLQANILCSLSWWRQIALFCLFSDFCDNSVYL